MKRASLSEHRYHLQNKQLACPSLACPRQ